MKFSTWTPKLDKIKSMKASDWLIVLLLGLLLLIAAIPGGGSGSVFGKGSQKKMESAESTEAAGESRDAYCSHLESRLEKILEQMQGAGKVKVMITLKDKGEAVLDKDITKSSESVEENTVIFDDGNATAPYVTKENTPEVMGVIVVAEGGADKQTQTQITEAVQAVLGIETHRIQVFPMEKEKG